MADQTVDSRTPARVATYATLTTAAAVEIAAACAHFAADRGREVSIAVVDRDGGLLVGQRPHARRPNMLTLATAKAFTAATMRIPTAAVEAWGSDKPGVLGIARMISEQPLITGAGGTPISVDGDVVGGLGLSGAPGDEDDLICGQALASLGYSTDFNV